MRIPDAGRPMVRSKTWVVSLPGMGDLGWRLLNPKEALNIEEKPAGEKLHSCVNR
jgi:hypothetical protein